jgi:hypothetical protein
VAVAALAAVAVIAQTAAVPVSASASDVRATTAASCTISGTAGPDVLTGTEGPDVLCGGSGDDSLVGMGGDDVLRGENGSDVLIGGDGADVLEGGNDGDRLEGEAGADALDGGDGPDVLLGGADDDTLAGANGADDLDGGLGDDRLDGGRAEDVCTAELDAKLLTGCEVVIPVNPDGERDSDKDVLGDDLERRFGSDPTKADTDGDGLSDAQELTSSTDPASADTDSDGVRDPADDTDADEVDNATELADRTSPTTPDTDSDGSTDGEEKKRGTDPLVADTDVDGLTDGQELSLGSDPRKADTDGDGVLDGVDTFDRLISLPEANARFLAQGTGEAVLAVELGPVQDALLQEVPGQRAPPVEVHAPEPLVSGTLTLHFDGTSIPAGSRLALLHFDETTGTFDRPADQTIDVVTGTATVTTSSFSPFILVDLDDFERVWAGEITTPRDGSGSKPLDAAVVLDSSGSMSWNDPGGARRTAGKAFVDVLLSGDRAAVVDFDHWATVVQALTEDMAAVKAAIDTIDASGGTDIGAGLRAALDELDRLGTPDRARVVVLLTDGEGSYDLGLTTRAAASGTVVYTVGLGSSVNSGLLQSIADGTGGKYYQVASANDLVTTFQRIGGNLGAPDTDGDGLADAAETAGLRDGAGRTYRTNPNKRDTDDDGLDDGAEAGRLQSGGPFGTGTWFPMPSDPTRADTDGDGLTDGDEVGSGLKPRNSDSDRDRLGDLTETELEFDPLTADGDKDGRLDDRELKDGTDPYVFDLGTFDKGQSFIGGALFGEAGRSWVARNVARLTEAHLTSPWYLAGWLAGGYVAIGDIRDTAYSLAKGSFGDAVLNAIGLVPFAGDALKTTRVSLDYVKLVPKGSLPALRWLSQNVPLGPFRRIVDNIVAKLGPQRLQVDKDRQALGRTPIASRSNKIGTDPVQAQALKDDIDRVTLEGATDIRVNQEQVIAGPPPTRVGRNRPDLQYTDAQGRRVYVEYDRPMCSDRTRSKRGAMHEQRIKANDPTAIVILKLIGQRCD